MGFISQPCKHSGGGGATLTVLQNAPPSSSDSNAVYLLDYTLPANTLKKNAGIIAMSIAGVVTTQVGGAPATDSTLTWVAWNPGQGGNLSANVPDTTTTISNGILIGGTTAEVNIAQSNGWLPNEAGTQIFIEGSCYLYNDGGNGVMFGSIGCATYSGPPPTAIQQFNRQAVGGFELNAGNGLIDFTQQIFLQVVLTREFPHVGPPLNFASWTPSGFLPTQIALVS